MFLEDKPNGVDLFESESHKNIALSMIKIIANDNLYGDIIGLEGEWGSGKSNVIEIMKKEANDECEFFIYNAWGHQEDYQRRAILEELTDYLIDEKLLLDDEKWQSNLQNLLSRKTKKTTKTVPSLNRGYFWMVLILFLNSFTRSLSMNAFNDITPNVIESFFKLHIVSEIGRSLILFILRNSPIILSVCGYVLSKFKKCEWKKNCFKKELLKGLDKILAIYKDKELENTVETISSTLEPTVKEFNDWMEEISLSLNKKIVIVFDDMDRLPQENAKNLWSSIHTFFSYSSYKNIKVIIPFDRYQIRRIFNGKNEEKSNEKYRDEADKFIDKTFSLVYRVTPPVISDWKNYFALKFRELDIMEEDKVLIEVRNLYDYKNERIKPREIILFLNELAVINDLWKGEIPLKYIALFILNKNEFMVSNPTKKILGQEYLENTGELFDENVRKYLSAIVFNVPISKASQVLLEREIISAIRIKDIDEFKKLIEVPEFDHIFESYLNNIENLENTIYIVYHTLFNNDTIFGTIEIVIESLTNKFLKNKIDKISFEEYMKYLLLMNQKVSIKKIFNYLVESYSTFDDINGKEYYDAINGMVNLIKTNELEYNIFDKLSNLNLTVEEYLKFLEESAENPIRYKITTDKKNLMKFYSDMIDENKFENEKIELMRFVDTSKGYE